MSGVTELLILFCYTNDLSRTVCLDVHEVQVQIQLLPQNLCSNFGTKFATIHQNYQESESNS